MLKIRRPLGRLIFNMGIAIPGKTVFLIETAPWSAVSEKISIDIAISVWLEDRAKRATILRGKTNFTSKQVFYSLSYILSARTADHQNHKKSTLTGINTFARVWWPTGPKRMNFMSWHVQSFVVCLRINGTDILMVGKFMRNRSKLRWIVWDNHLAL